MNSKEFKTKALESLATGKIDLNHYNTIIAAIPELFKDNDIEIEPNRQYLNVVISQLEFIDLRGVQSSQELSNRISTVINFIKNNILK